MCNQVVVLSFIRSTWFVFSAKLYRICHYKGVKWEKKDNSIVL